MTLNNKIIIYQPMEALFVDCNRESGSMNPTFQPSICGLIKGKDDL